MGETMITNYDDVKIEYDEKANKWRFELRGRERSADSLAKAKEFIDKEPKEKKAFTRTPAYLTDWSFSRFSEVDVTSIAEAPAYSNSKMFWISNSERREKVEARNLFANCDSNEVLIAAIKRIDDEAGKLDKQRTGIIGKLKPFTVSKEILD